MADGDCRKRKRKLYESDENVDVKVLITSDSTESGSSEDSSDTCTIPNLEKNDRTGSSESRGSTDTGDSRPTSVTSSDSPLNLKFLKHTSDWTEATLNKLKIVSKTTDAYSLSHFTSLLMPKAGAKDLMETVHSCLHMIKTNPTALDKLNVEAIDNISSDELLAFLFFEKAHGRVINTDVWDLKSRPSTSSQKFQDWFAKRFEVYGRSFTEQLYLLRMKKTGITELMYQKLFQEFLGMFGIKSYDQTSYVGEKLKIGEDTVTSVPDIVLPDFTSVLENNGKDLESKILAVIEVKNCFKEDDVISPKETRSHGKTLDRKIVRHLDENLLGQHGGELLVYLPFSRNYNFDSPDEKAGLMGMIVQKTYVTLSYLLCGVENFVIVKTGKPHVKRPISIEYSKPYNYLLQKDREELMQCFLTLSVLQNPFANGHHGL